MVLDFLSSQGRPSLHPDWKPLKPDDYSYLHIDKEFTVEKGLPLQVSNK